MRLDKYLVKKSYFLSRNKCLEAIKGGFVFVNKKLILKASTEVGEDDFIEIKKKDFYLSRGANKLRTFLDGLDLDLKGFNCLDIGSSTGGFCQVLLEEDVKSVLALDVGKNQLHPLLKKDARLFSKENCDIRDFTSFYKYDLITCDISFISVSLILKYIDNLSKDSIIILLKPQFEVGRDIKRNKNGVVLDKDAIKKAQLLFEDKCRALNWSLEFKEESSLKGKKGNIEYFYYYKKCK